MVSFWGRFGPCFFSVYFVFFSCLFCVYFAFLCVSFRSITTLINTLVQPHFNTLAGRHLAGKYDGAESAPLPRRPRPGPQPENVRGADRPARALRGRPPSHANWL